MFTLTTDPFDILQLCDTEDTCLFLPPMDVPADLRDRWRASRRDAPGLVQEWFEKYGPGTDANLFDEDDLRAALNRTQINQAFYFVEAAAAVAFWEKYRIRSIGETLRRNPACTHKAEVLDRVLPPDIAAAIRTQAYAQVNDKGNRNGGEPDLLLYRDNDWAWCEVKQTAEPPTATQRVYNPKLVAATGRPILVQRLVIH